MEIKQTGAFLHPVLVGDAPSLEEMLKASNWEERLEKARAERARVQQERTAEKARKAPRPKPWERESYAKRAAVARAATPAEARAPKPAAPAANVAPVSNAATGLPTAEDSIAANPPAYLTLARSSPRPASTHDVPAAAPSGPQDQSKLDWLDSALHDHKPAPPPQPRLRAIRPEVEFHADPAAAAPQPASRPVAARLRSGSVFLVLGLAIGTGIGSIIQRLTIDPAQTVQALAPVVVTPTLSPPAPVNADMAALPVTGFAAPATLPQSPVVAALPEAQVSALPAGTALRAPGAADAPVPFIGAAPVRPAALATPPMLAAVTPDAAPQLDLRTVTPVRVVVFGAPLAALQPDLATPAPVASPLPVRLASTAPKLTYSNAAGPDLPQRPVPLRFAEPVAPALPGRLAPQPELKLTGFGRVEVIARVAALTVVAPPATAAPAPAPGLLPPHADGTLLHRVALPLVPPAQVNDDAIVTAAATPPPLLGSGINVSLHVPTNVADAALEDLTGALAHSGAEISTPLRVDLNISKTNVRYFRAADAGAAQLLADSIGASARDFTGFSPSPPDGTIEIWVAGSAPAHRTARQKTVARSPQPSADEQRLLALRDRILHRLRSGELY